MTITGSVASDFCNLPNIPVFFFLLNGASNYNPSCYNWISSTRSGSFEAYKQASASSAYAKAQARNPYNASSINLSSHASHSMKPVKSSMLNLQRAVLWILKN
ncbi:hypothetical protein HI914_02142 [Erysiphe necator]|nr:hypothetical protein HI914_02142 [Erysiphe necator]